MAKCLKRLTRVAAQDRVAEELTDRDQYGSTTPLDRPVDGLPPVTVVAAIHQPNYEVSHPIQTISQKVVLLVADSVAVLHFYVLPLDTVSP